MTKVVAIIQSRQGSTRLPGKALTPLHKGKGALELMLERIQPSQTIDQIMKASRQGSSTLNRHISSLRQLVMLRKTYLGFML